MNAWLKTRTQGKPGNSGPAAFAFFCPGPGTSPKKSFLPTTQNPLLDPPQHGAVAQRVQTADFFGASSVASALDVARRRDPADNDLTLSPSLPPRSQNRNFLLCTK